MSKNFKYDLNTRSIMNRRTYLVILVAVLIACACLSTSVAADSMVSGLNSTSDFSNAVNLAKTQNKTILLIFDQDSCVYCDLLKENTLSDSNIQKELNGNYITVFVDINKDYALAEKYRIHGTPSMVFIDSDGGELGRIGGYVGADELLNEIERM